MADQTTVLNQCFLDCRCMILEIAAALDRVDRAENAGKEDVRLSQLQQALRVLIEPTVKENRSQRILTMFSDPID